MHTITITKIDHDDYLGYYIDDTLYAYTDYHDINDNEVKLESLVRAFEAGLITNRADANVVFVEKYDLPNYSNELDEATVNDLPNSLAVLKEHYANFQA